MAYRNSFHNSSKEGVLVQVLAALQEYPTYQTGKCESSTGVEYGLRLLTMLAQSQIVNAKPQYMLKPLKVLREFVHPSHVS